MISFYYRSKEQEGEMKVIIVVDNSMFLYGSEIAYITAPENKHENYSIVLNNPSIPCKVTIQNL